MPLKSPFPDLTIPEKNLISHVFPEHRQPSTTHQWVDANDPVHTLSSAQALCWAKRFASGLDREQVSQQTTILLISPNNIFLPAVFYGIVGSGRIFSGASPAYTVTELAHQIKITSPRIILVHPSILDRALEAVEVVNSYKTRILQFSDKPNSTLRGVPDWRVILDSESNAERYHWPDFPGQTSRKMIATLNFSSGTTGLPKGVAISHHNIIANLEQARFMLSLGRVATQNDRWIGFLPMYHAYGQLYYCLMCAHLNTPVYVVEKFEFRNLLCWIQDYRITMLQLVPPADIIVSFTCEAILKMLVDRPEPAEYDLSSVKDILSGAAPLSQELGDRVRKQFGVTILEGYGMSELTCTAIQTPLLLAKNGTTSLGVLVPNTECRLLSDNGVEVADGEPGEIHIRGPQAFQGYWRNDQATQDTKKRDGWIKTGDIAVTRGDEFWIVDRKKELIKVNGLQVSPAELEAVLGENEHIADVGVIGVGSARGEVPRAYVVLHDNSKDKVAENDISSWVEQRVARHKRLDGGVIIVDQIPRLASGKVERKTLRKWVKDDQTRGLSSKI
ncbi:hypothetical protein BGW36DRAFT_422545 [Talaromyces proteolyticus]|uniref:Uncharacterized protein n=1 Tax=Talaromyces proteolyticus TaxID=1131652 RepID=A0AAD4L1V8_9EURO|nr:uncharacterized protein BGW36DRAFT_422545 [Talaromyces proteolyticus]KAH8706022.1 hypothetical protein BGW36DRAFT_422545 [Talaromyces proteolyticus]